MKIGYGNALAEKLSGSFHRRHVVNAFQRARALVLGSFKAYIPNNHRKSNRFRLLNEQPRDGYVSNICGAWRRYSAGMLA